VAIRIPEIERRRLKLKGQGPSWILLDEGNRDILPGSWYLEPVTHHTLTFSYGNFSRAFVSQMLRLLAEAIRTRQVAQSRDSADPRRLRAEGDPLAGMPVFFWVAGERKTRRAPTRKCLNGFPVGSNNGDSATAAYVVG
jgi:hypothetical protein